MLKLRLLFTQMVMVLHIRHEQHLPFEIIVYVFVYSDKIFEIKFLITIVNSSLNKGITDKIINAMKIIQQFESTVY